ncbi:MAG: HEAT repeat domain-containing protein [Leptolyngbyaceae cyanobacterium RM1_1_2]|nr:HEAT repeat domain-containing protein [Leptolyngbyaceae cyanobacterium RM1_1_2]
MANTQVLRLIRAVDAADSPAELVKAVEDLAATGAEAAIPTLIAVLSYSNPRAARAAVDGLIKLDITAVPFLLEHIQEGSSYSARAWAIEALSGIGDPQGLETLLRATTQDFSMSVRRAAARGLGKLRWQMMASEQVLSGQSKVIETLFQAVQDSEWIVRYAAVVGLQGFAAAVFISCPSWVISIEMRLAQTAGSDDSLAVQARPCWPSSKFSPV